jgi:hypothetical protein
MASERLDLPPVPSVARIIQPANEDTALFILQSVLKTGAHLPAGKWSSLAQLLWDSPPTQVPFTVSSGSGRQLGIPGTSSCLLKRFSAIMGSSTPSRTPTHPPSRPWLGASAARRRLRLSRSASVVMPTLVACRRALLKTTIKRALGMLPEGTGVNAPHVRGAPPSRQQELQDACAILALNPRSTNSHFRLGVVPGGHSFRPLVSPVFADNRADNHSINLAACPAVSTGQERQRG